jgi:hypothetical protein
MYGIELPASTRIVRVEAVVNSIPVKRKLTPIFTGKKHMIKKQQLYSMKWNRTRTKDLQYTQVRSYH